jgi:MoaA/NifB/PqqE/SkfB family radical SAM enzyme
LRDAGLRELFVSLDGPPAVHDRIRGQERAFDRAFAGMAALADRGPRMSVFCVITEWNTGHLGDLLRELRGLPLREVGFMLPNYTTAAMVAAQAGHWPAYPATESNVAGMSILSVDRDQLWAEIQAVRAGAWPFRVTFAPDVRSREDLDAFFLDPARRFARGCTDAWRALMIKSDGSVIPAHGRCYRITAGNIRETELDALWNAPALARLRRDLRRAGGLFPACTRCCSAMG